MRKEIFRRVADSIRFRFPIPYQAEVIGIEGADSRITGQWNVKVKVGEREMLLENVRGYYLSGVNPGDLVRVSREEVIFGEPTIEKIEKQKE